MSINVLRAHGAWWIQRGDAASRLEVAAATTAELLANRKVIEAAAESASLVFDTPVASLALESPVTTPCRVVAQLVNYRSHAKESGFDPGKLQPTFFRKASGSVTGPTAQVVKPAHTRLLDYEVELGLVIGARVPVGTVVTDWNIHEYVAGLVVANDISARDIQLTKGQFYESKSYPTFTPVGPALALLEPGEFAWLQDLRLSLSVDGVLRQDRPAADMIHLPAASLTALARFQALAPGDLVLTGTPGGTALQAPPHAMELVAHFVPAQVKWKLFFDRQAKNPKYLQPGNRVSAAIRTDDGLIDLGSQDWTVVAQ
jgi:2-keto-4-pentenoate hydratase/2-oxohepta-3-ene-1,7-dioic acid hydratase in catechol pathway